MSENLPRFPSGFVFGTSTASYQIEGAASEDGKGPSIWDTFAHTPGKIADGSTGDVACDHYHRVAEDVALMKAMGAGGYRFSISWPRVMPTGRGPVNAAGLDFYDRLVDELLAAGIAPMATLYHWDLPQALEDEGGWLARGTAEAFTPYAEAVAERLADRVAYWCPINEPNVVTVLGYALGVHAPGKSLLFDALPAAHHVLLAHGNAVAALRAAGAKSVGCATSHTPVHPLTQEPNDVEAAGLYDALWNRLFADPMMLGHYPEVLAPLLPVQAGDLETISAPLDFYGVNYYNPSLVGAGDKQPAGERKSIEHQATQSLDLPFSLHPMTGYPMTDFDWPVVPAGLTELLLQLKERYPNLPPVAITENGCSYATGPDANGVVDDQARIDFYDGHLRAVGDAIEAGVDVWGYFAWSLLDNFEWAEGYQQRFGLVHVDYDTLVRTPKNSYHWFSRVIAGQG